MPSHLSSRVRALVDDVFAVRANALGRQLDAIRCELDEPLRVLIAGRANAGKSTLVNALLGRRVAPTGQLETTRVPTVFRFADREDAAVVLRSGERRSLDFEDGALPRETGVRDELVALIDVRLSVRNGVLDAVALIDSPGSDTLTPAVARSADELLGTRNDGLPPAVRRTPSSSS
jgi:energy-coupling factor transporter ATP-binding protein EcfA2